MQTFVIAEAGVNHCGRLDLALSLVDSAAESGADAVKFQTFTADTLVTRSAATVAYQQQTTGYRDQHAMVAELELSARDHQALADRARARGIEFMSTAFDPVAAELLVRLGVKRLKVPSGEITNAPLLRKLASYKLPLLLSTGMSDLAEIKAALAVIREASGVTSQASVCVLHCTSAYPTSDDDVNLAALRTIRDAFDVPVGYSDHTSDIFVAPLAVAMGAVVIEKHLTLDRNLPGPDHRASLLPDEMRAMIINLRRSERLLGDGVKAPRPVEAEARQLVRRGLKAARRLPLGHILTSEDIAILRPAAGIEPIHCDQAIGRRTAASLEAGEPIYWTSLDKPGS